MSANDEYEAERVFDSEVRPVSWAWRNCPKPPPDEVSFPSTMSSEDYWRYRLANEKRTRNAQRERQDAPGTTDKGSVR